MADRIIVVDNEDCTMWCYPVERLMSHQWHKFCSAENFRNVMSKAIDAFETYNCIKWLSDDRDFGALHPDDITWGRENWYPRVFEKGWKFHAMVLPKIVTGRLSLINNVVNYGAENGVKVKIFANPDEGKKWLDSKGTLGIDLTSRQP